MIHLPGVLVEVDNDDDDDNDDAVAAVDVRPDRLLDFDSWFVYGETLAIGFFSVLSVEFADWNSDDQVFEGAGAGAVAAPPVDCA